VIRLLIYLSILLSISACTDEISDKELIKRINQEISKQDWINADKNLEELINRHPENTEIYETRAMVLTHFKDTLSTLKVIENATKCLKYQPNNDLIRFIRFHAYFIKGSTDSALSDINYLCKNQPKKVELLIWKADCEFNGRLFNESLKTYKTILKIGGSYQLMEKSYYYQIYSKYFSGDLKGAFWDCGFLETMGFKENQDLMKKINDRSLYFEQVAFTQMPEMDINSIKKIINAP
jgi:hypothetical protein